MDLRERMRAQWVASVEDWIGQDQAVRTDMLDTWMLDALGDVSGKQVLDIGCGEGRFCRLLAGMGAEVTGIDLTAGLVDAARGLSNGIGNYLVGNAEDLAGLDDETYDLAVSYIVMVDIFDYESSIRAAHRVLKPGGRFIVCTIHPIRLARQPIGWITQGDKKALLPRRRLHVRRSARVDLVGQEVRQRAPHSVKLRLRIPGFGIRPGGHKRADSLSRTVRHPSRMGRRIPCAQLHHLRAEKAGVNRVSRKRVPRHSGAGSP